MGFRKRARDRRRKTHEIKDLAISESNGKCL